MCSANIPFNDACGEAPPDLRDYNPRLLGTPSRPLVEYTLMLFSCDPTNTMRAADSDESESHSLMYIWSGPKLFFLLHFHTNIGLRRHVI